MALFQNAFKLGFFVLFLVVLFVVVIVVVYYKESRALFCLQEKGVTQSFLLIPEISRTVSRLQVHFKFAFGTLFLST